MAPIDSGELRRVMGHFATGVAIVTSQLDGAPCGMSANSLASVSLDPPLVLFCADRTSETFRGIAQSGFFAVSILDEGHEHVARAFAQKGPEKFEGAPVRRGATGAPILGDALAWLDCTVHAAHEGGDHAIFLGLVEAAGAHPGEPLVFWRGGYHTLDG